MEAARQDAIGAQERAAEWFGAFAKDFPAFATDSLLNELSGDLKGELEKNLAELRDAAGGWSDPAKAAAMAEAMKQRLQPGAEALAQQEREAEDLAAVGAVLEIAAELEAIHEEQRDVSGRLGRLARDLALGRDTNRGDLPALRERQMKNRERLDEAREKLPGRLGKLPAGYEDLKQGAEKVIEMLDSLQVPQQMGDSARQAGEGKVPGAAEDAGLALANLDQILAREKNSFCQACQGGKPGFLGGDGAAASALSQMMDALRGRARAKGPGQQSGDQSGGAGGGLAGMGGRGGSGTTMRGIQLDIPIIGPPRLNLSTPPAGLTAPGREPGPVAAVPAAGDTETLPAGSAAAPGGRAWSPDDVPPKYREAAKRFFSEEIRTASPTHARSMNPRMPTFLLAALLAASIPARAKEGIVQCANLIYGPGKTSTCFSDEFLSATQRETSIVTDRRFKPVKLDSDDLFRYPFAIMTGEGDFSLTPRERENLKKYLDGGGFLLASAGCSNEEWDRAFRREMKAALNVEKLDRLAADHAVFRTVFRIDDLGLNKSEGNGHLEGVSQGGRLVMIYSSDGLNNTANAPGCCCCGGNELTNSLQINVNILAYALLH